MNGGLIPEAAVREVRERASLVELVSRSVALRRRGRNYVGICPFHAEKTPSFTVNEDKGFFHCFGCGASGDVFTFLMRTRQLTFPEAVRALAAELGVAVPERVGGGRGPRTEPLVAVNATAAEFFADNLWNNHAGQRARRYLHERGIEEEVSRRFGLGYAPAGGEALVRYLRSRRAPAEAALSVGLVLRRTGGTLVDRFQDRLVFPIRDAAGVVRGFGARLLPGRAAEGRPKYVNSPDSPIYHKGRLLYGLDCAREAISGAGRAVLVEGYLDVITLAAAGIEEVVAPLGTALGAEQVRLLRRYTEEVIACFDGDAAGRRAAARSFPVLLEAGFWGKAVFLPAGEDPDSFVRRKGVGELKKLLAAPEPLVDAFLGELCGGGPATLARRAQAAREIARVLKRVRNPFEFDLLAKRAAECLGVSEAVLRSEGAPAAASQPAELGLGVAGAEALLVEMIAGDPAVGERVAGCGILAEFTDQHWRQLAERFIAAGDGPGRSALLEELPPAMRERVARRLLGDEGGEAQQERERAIVDCIGALRAARAKRTRLAVLEELKAAEAQGDEEAAALARRRLKELYGAAARGAKA